MEIHWKRKEVIRYITDDVEISSDDFDKEWLFFNKLVKSFTNAKIYVL